MMFRAVLHFQARVYKSRATIYIVLLPYNEIVETDGNNENSK